MNKILHGSSTIQFSNNEWNMLKNSLNHNVIKKEGTYTYKILNYNMSMKSRKQKVMKYIIRIESKDDFKKIVKVIGINAIFHLILKYPLVTKGDEPLIVIRNNNWIKILIEGIVEINDKFSYITQN